MLLAAGNAAVYVAQIEDGHMTGPWPPPGTSRVRPYARHGGLWFNDELFVIARRA